MLKRLNKKGMALLIAGCVLLVGAVGSTVAYLVDRTETVTDVFEPANVKCAVLENDNGTYSVKNESNIPVYIRVAVVANAVAADGKILPVAATFELDIKEGWTTNTYYYYNDIVAGDSSVSLGKISVDDGIIVNVLAEAIQSTPTDAVIEAWGFVPGAEN